ncbi:MBL fold metallo-hydrolase [Bradyrhizobium brasilense]|uniref:MBL fold metallo-hydrolase n=1 Tax=Bradyrhizobium brasilense TaxID=1419277 RepID=UPI001E301242|nr:MBL fold metallo-hydrolase [Bradyrhizobium brasilense]MCC8971580.1 MBL fold metallo-hydrolase [Bradyrhizobium brasilense]
MFEKNNTLRVGRYRLEAIPEFEGARMPPAAMFTKASPAHLDNLLERVPSDSYDRDRKVLCTSVHSWLVRDDNGIVMLIDTCFGNLKNRMPSHPMFHMQSNDWLAKLGALGVEPQDVTHVINTHLHLDHVGWNTRLVDGVWTPTFPHARHIMPRLEAELALSGGLMRHEANERSIADSVRPVIDAGLADFVDPHVTIAADMKLVPCYGHSQGMLLVEIAGEPGAIVGGDPLHHPLQMLDPDVNTGFCEQPEQAASSRRKFLARCADEGLIIAPTHFYAPRFSQVKRIERGFDLTRISQAAMPA